MREIDFPHDLLPLKDRLFRLARRMVQNPAEAEDLVQDTYLRVWEHRSSLSEVKSLEAYCLTVCRNLALDRLALHEHANRSLQPESDDRPDTTPSPHERVEQHERMEQLNQALAALPEKQRTVVQLRDIEGRTTRETAEIMQFSEEAVKVNLFRARQALRQIFFKQQP